MCFNCLFILTHKVQFIYRISLSFNLQLTGTNLLTSVLPLSAVVNALLMSTAAFIKVI